MSFSVPQGHSTGKLKHRQAEQESPPSTLPSSTPTASPETSQRKGLRHNLAELMCVAAQRTYVTGGPYRLRTPGTQELNMQTQVTCIDHRTENDSRSLFSVSSLLRKGRDRRDKLCFSRCAKQNHRKATISPELPTTHPAGPRPHPQ